MDLGACSYILLYFRLFRLSMAPQASAIQMAFMYPSLYKASKIIISIKELAC